MLRAKQGGGELQSSSSEGVHDRSSCRGGLMGICTWTTPGGEAGEPERFRGNQICRRSAYHEP